MYRFIQEEGGGINSDSDVSDEDPNEEGIGTPKTPKNGEVSVITPASKTNGNDRRKIDFTVINNPQYSLPGNFSSLFIFQEEVPPGYPLFLTLVKGK